MPRPHAPFCTLTADGRGHGPYCVSRPLARPVQAVTEQGKRVTVTVDVAVKRAHLAGPHLVRIVQQPPSIEHRFVLVLAVEGARQLAAALLNAARHVESASTQLRAPRTDAR